MDQQQELELKREELDNNKYFRRRTLQLQSRDLLLKTITNPLLIAIISVIAGLYGSALLERQKKADQALLNLRSEDDRQLAQRRFCYDVARDLILTSPERRKEAAADLEGLVQFNLIKDCEGDLREIADFYSRTPAPPVDATQAPDATCERTESIRTLGWRSGHKTKFCVAHGFDGVHNPFGNYSEGGYCFKGDSQACIAKIQADSAKRR